MKAAIGLQWLVVSGVAMMLGLAVQAEANTVTIATFADPALDATTPLFTVDVTNSAVTGGWPDDQTGLNLEIPGVGIFSDAWFQMTPLAYTGTITSGSTLAGTISFYKDGDDPDLIPPLVQLIFDSAQVTPGGLFANELLSLNDVEIIGSAVTSGLMQESFSFAFANQKLLNQGEGFTATASFTSSALPEPATLALLVLSGLLASKRRQG